MKVKKAPSEWRGSWACCTSSSSSRLVESRVCVVSSDLLMCTAQPAFSAEVLADPYHPSHVARLVRAEKVLLLHGGGGGPASAVAGAGAGDDGGAMAGLLRQEAKASDDELVGALLVLCRPTPVC